jgi:hypothetical protein
LEWLFARLLTSADADALLGVIEPRMPEAMPHRFGTFEPPQGTLERDGKAAFSALFDDVHHPFWKGKRPFQWVSCTSVADGDPRSRRRNVMLVRRRSAAEVEYRQTRFGWSSSPSLRPMSAGYKQ